ncbi:hypothetical protein GJV26_12450 [Massilia dura]|uniref:Phytanoyl-CoA dioxygenase n=1 Tax=Pseudoduganella dura TaxID=321982 RepID=A0A6I3X8W3_9BURK|nr:phytanoyl-CoA dioxygenase family protein [Pseudoduganella dura]MUI13264.1 hypothetical protein [Pseudoduganella dura]GGX90523.1 hypothetical protein GCM10007386_21710 [Pseudoduganella dura]
MRYARLTPGHGFKPANSFLYYLQRLTVSPPLRGLCVRMFRNWVRARHGISLRVSAPAQLQLLDRLHAEGYAPLGNVLSKNQCDDIHAWFADKVLTDRQNDGATFTLARVPPAARLAEYSLRDIVRCPHIMALANDSRLLELAERYIGCKPTISQLGVRWSFPSPGLRSDLQTFHRDSEDWRYFKVLVYLTDVGPGDGPHVYVRGTHKTRAPVRLKIQTDGEISREYGDDRLITAIGEQGFGFAVDTAGVHKGTPPAIRPRLMLQIQYSLFRSYAYVYEPEPCADAFSFDRYINRLILS